MRGVVMPKWVRSFRVWRVSSAAMRSTSLRTRRARRVMSSRLPMGVATMNNELILNFFLRKLKSIRNNFYLEFISMQGKPPHIKADLNLPQAFLFQVIIRQPAHPGLFGGGDRVLGFPEPDALPGLHLNEDQVATVPGDEVDLPQRRHIIALQDLVALLFQSRGGQVFAGVA